MWPLLLDMTKEESMQTLRCLELEAYAGLVTALRAQGPLSSEKIKLLKDTGTVLNISQDRHKAEVRRAVNDEKLNTVAYHVSGQKVTSDEWTQEGRRLIPLMPRIAPQTAYSAIADEVADTANKNNKLLPNPCSTERKRPASITTQSGLSDLTKPISFKVPELHKSEDAKKRKISIPESSNLVQHLMGPPKLSKIQQIYRQKTKARQKELQLKVKQELDKQDGATIQQKMQQQIQQKISTPQINQVGSPKVNVIQTISLPTAESENIEIKLEPGDASMGKSTENSLSPQPGCSNENIAPKTKLLSTPKLNQHITLKHVTSASPAGDKQIKVCNTKKNIATKCITTGQKLIVVSNPQSITTSSILQRTLTIPFVKNISVKNFDKFKIVTTNAGSNIHLTTLTTSGSATTGKHKVVTVRTNPNVKKVIPLSQLQMLNAKGGIKVLPIGGKIVTKTSTGNAPVYIVNSGNMQCITKSITSTPIIMTCKTQDTLDNKSLLVLKSPDLNACTKEPQTENVDTKVKDKIQERNKSNVLADIMEAVGVVPSDGENFIDDIQVKTEENQEEISQSQEENNVIKEQKTENLNAYKINIETLATDQSNVANGAFSYIIDEKPSLRTLQEIKIEESCSELKINDNSNSSTGFYSLTAIDDSCESLNTEESKESVISESSTENIMTND